MLTGKATGKSRNILECLWDCRTPQLKGGGTKFQGSQSFQSKEGGGFRGLEDCWGGGWGSQLGGKWTGIGWIVKEIFVSRSLLVGESKGKFKEKRVYCGACARGRRTCQGRRKTVSRERLKDEYRRLERKESS